MEEELGGAARDETFDIDDILDLQAQCEKLKFARVLMGDEWVRTNLHEDPDLLEANLSERRDQAREKLAELARH